MVFKIWRPWGNGTYTRYQHEGRRRKASRQGRSAQLQPILFCPLLCFFPFVFGFGCFGLWLRFHDFGSLADAKQEDTSPCSHGFAWSSVGEDTLALDCCFFSFWFLGTGAALEKCLKGDEVGHSNKLGEKWETRNLVLVTCHLELWTWQSLKQSLPQFSFYSEPLSLHLR